MLRSFLLAALLVGASAVSVPTTYCDSAKDSVNRAHTLSADVWPPVLGSRVVLTLTSDVDDVILNTSFKINQEFLPVSEGVTKIAFDVPSGAHTGLYSLDIHGKKDGAEVVCVQAEWSMTSTVEERGTKEMWNDVAKRIARLDLEREQLKREHELNPPEDVDLPEFKPDFDPQEAHERMMRTHDQVHAIYPHMMARQQPDTEVEDVAAPEVLQAAA